MAKKVVTRSFDDVLALLGTQRFDVAAAHEGAQRRTGAVRVSKLGCAAELMGTKDSVTMLQKPGWVLGGEICRIVDKGYQKFIKNSRIEIPATADILRALHNFELELNAATGKSISITRRLGPRATFTCTTGLLVVRTRISG